jgi:site-specific DNA-methyltransferase (adenine-specific)
MFFHADCLKFLPYIETGSIDMVFVDPPFNLGKQYERDHYNDSMATEVYRTWCHDWLLELVRVIRPGGALFLYHWPFWLMQLGAWLQTLPAIQYKSWIALKMKSGFPIVGRLHPAHYGLLYFVKKGAKATFNKVRHRTPTCRHCGKMTRDYGGYRKKFEKYEDEDGIPWIQISDFWEDTRPARQDKTRDNQINELPLHIPERAILMATNPGDVVLDVFGGGGSTFHAAQMHDRLWVGSELGDTTPTIRRLNSFFDAPIELPKGRLRQCFSEDFWNGKVADVDVAALKATIGRVAPIENIVGSMDEYGSKSKTLGF